MEVVSQPESIGTVFWSGRRVDLLNPDKLSGREKRVLKTVSRGMAPIECLNRLEVLDPDAWIGLLFVSISRVDPRVTETQLEKDDTLDKLIASYEANPELVGEDGGPFEGSGGGGASDPAGPSDVEATRGTGGTS